VTFPERKQRGRKKWKKERMELGKRKGDEMTEGRKVKGRV